MLGSDTAHLDPRERARTGSEETTRSEMNLTKERHLRVSSLDQGMEAGVIGK